MRILLQPRFSLTVAWMLCQAWPSSSFSQSAGEPAPVVFDNLAGGGGLNPAGASPASQIDAAFPFDAGAADDFILPDSPQCRWSITSVEWTGKYWADSAPGSMSGFRITFWPDSAGAPFSGLGALPDPSLAIAVYNIPGLANEASSASGSAGAFDYSAELPQPLELMPGVPYWLQIQAISAFPPQWGVHITHSRQGLAPVQYFDLLNLPAWTAVPDEGDLAFRLLGAPKSIDCDDGNACTSDACAGGSCLSTPLVCDDGDTCTLDSCDPSAGCSFVPVECGDTDACTVDVCDAGVCLHRTPPDFDGDGDVDLADYDAIVSCLMNQESSNGSCSCKDLSGDGQVDLRDIGAFQSTYTGSK